MSEARISVDNVQRSMDTLRHDVSELSQQYLQSENESRGLQAVMPMRLEQIWQLNERVRQHASTIRKQEEEIADLQQSVKNRDATITELDEALTVARESPAEVWVVRSYTSPVSAGDCVIHGVFSSRDAASKYGRGLANSCWVSRFLVDERASELKGEVNPNDPKSD